MPHSLRRKPNDITCPRVQQPNEHCVELVEGSKTTTFAVRHFFHVLIQEVRQMEREQAKERSVLEEIATRPKSDPTLLVLKLCIKLGLHKKGTPRQPFIMYFTNGDDSSIFAEDSFLFTAYGQKPTSRFTLSASGEIIVSGNAEDLERAMGGE